MLTKRAIFVQMLKLAMLLLKDSSPVMLRRTHYAALNKVKLAVTDVAKTYAKDLEALHKRNAEVLAARINAMLQRFSTVTWEQGNDAETLTIRVSLSLLLLDAADELELKMITASVADEVKGKIINMARRVGEPPLSP